MNELVFEGIPDKDAAAFCQGVVDTLSQLGIEVDYDETSPADEKGEVKYRVVLERNHDSRLKHNTLIATFESREDEPKHEPVEWDCTDFIRDSGLVEKVEKAIAARGFWLDVDGDLRRDPEAPECVQNAVSGTFEITVAPDDVSD